MCSTRCGRAVSARVPRPRTLASDSSRVSVPRPSSVMSPTQSRGSVRRGASTPCARRRPGRYACLFRGIQACECRGTRLAVDASAPRGRAPRARVVGSGVRPNEVYAAGADGVTEDYPCSTSARTSTRAPSDRPSNSFSRRPRTVPSRRSRSGRTSSTASAISCSRGGWSPT